MTISGPALLQACEADLLAAGAATVGTVYYPEIVWADVTTLPVTLLVQDPTGGAAVALGTSTTEGSITCEIYFSESTTTIAQAEIAVEALRVALNAQSPRFVRREASWSRAGRASAGDFSDLFLVVLSIPFGLS